jgi:hypothetical protein|tara:strand:+ start:4578 stop:4757 length:180 start_codon:yes stop_codon:yes gene_type:complete
MAQPNRKAQLLALLYSMKTQGKESATFNIDWLIQAVHQPEAPLHPAEEPSDDDMDGGEF